MDDYTARSVNSRWWETGNAFTLPEEDDCHFFNAPTTTPYCVHYARAGVRYTVSRSSEMHGNELVDRTTRHE